MSSSTSSDSDSDDLEPIRRIKINIKPKESVKSSGADVDAIKASVDAWRPLGPRPHHSLTRRQSSLSSMSSLSFGANSIQGSGGGTGGSSSTTATSSSGFNYNLNGSLNGPSNVPIMSSVATTTRSNIYSTNTDHIGSNTFMRSSPSCSSLVNDFNNRTSFPNFMTSVSRTSSPLTFTNNYGDTVPIALAIQESVELTVKGQQEATQSEIKFDSRALGNIKVAFPNAYARSCSNGCKPSSTLKLRLHSTENILRYYASGLIRELDSDSNSPTESTSTNKPETDRANTNIGVKQNRNIDFFDMNESPTDKRSSTKTIEFDMDALMAQLKLQYDQSPNGRYYNVDALRYQIAPFDEFEKCPIQVCAYWRIEPKLIKLRIDFKHSSQSGFNLERLREVVFKADLRNLIPSNLNIEPVSPDAFATLRLSKKIDNNNLATFKNSSFDPNNGHARHQQEHQMAAPVDHQHSNHQYKNLINVSDTPNHESQSQQLLASFKQPATPIQIRLPPPPSKVHSRGLNTSSRHNLSSSSSSSTSSNNSLRRQHLITSDQQSAATKSSYIDSNLLSMNNTTQASNHDISYGKSVPAEASSNQQTMNFISANNHQATSAMQDQSVPYSHAQAPPVPYITYEPQANWNKHTKQLIWKFDNLLSYHKTDGYGSLLAKLDFRQCPHVDQEQGFSFGELLQQHPQTSPEPIDVKFMVVDATVSKVSLSVDSIGYWMSLLKKEVRSSRYKSEPSIS